VKGNRPEVYPLITNIVTNAIDPEATAHDEQESHPHVEERQDRPIGICANKRCRKGPDGTRGIVKSRKAKYCCAYCRVDVCRRSRPKAEQIEKPARKHRRDAKYTSHSERQRAYQARHRPYPLPVAIKDYLEIKAGSAGVVAKRVPEPV
jgi:hypothetical protein